MPSRRKWFGGVPCASMSGTGMGKATVPEKLCLKEGMESVMTIGSKVDESHCKPIRQELKYVVSRRPGALVSMQLT